MKTDLQKDIHNYISGQTNLDERLLFEERLKSDPFLADAVEGFELFPEMSRLPMDGVGVLKKIALAIIIIAIGCTWSYIWQTSNEGNLIHEKAEENPIAQPVPNIMEFDKSNVKITAMTLVQPAELDVPISEATLALPRKERIYLQEVDPINIKLTEPNISARYPEYRYRATYIHGLKVILIDTLRSFDEPKLPKHVPAQYESERKYQRSQSLYVPRDMNVHYMEKALAYFEKGQFRKSLEELNKTSHRLPNNLNIVFYQGLCLYHLEAYDAAQKHFRRTQSIMELGFCEESKWYEGLCFEKTGQIDRAMEIYRVILDQNSFYSMRAASRMALLQSE